MAPLSDFLLHRPRIGFFLLLLVAWVVTSIKGLRRDNCDYQIRNSNSYSVNKSQQDWYLHDTSTKTLLLEKESYKRPFVSSN